MLKSMTGYGRSVESCGGYTFTVEMKAVNHRYKEVVFRMPKDLFQFEERLKKKINEQIQRGRVDIYITMEKEEIVDEMVTVNQNLLNAYMKAMQSIQSNYPQVEGALTASDILRIPDIVSMNKQQLDADSLYNPLENAITVALGELVKFRISEGLEMTKDLKSRLVIVQELCQKVATLAPTVIPEYKDKLLKRVQELVSEDIRIEETRIATEVAIYADKSNIDEELTRLHSHIQQFLTFIHEKDAVGRKLDFLVQEMNREVNTIGSKSNHIDISKNVVELKSELEKIREQVQNIE